MARQFRFFAFASRVGRSSCEHSRSPTDRRLDRSADRLDDHVAGPNSPVGDYVEVYPSIAGRGVDW